ncbi:hypothetical protein JRQ81_004315 [Phrynocephalus forsythii]|uniref:Ig-like domain-containing protein n=1 Tax=Phrynocephalus forsythii TaxID=171643 RepID=A0A9Q1AUI3_9SAUR|nr:hypothetical protein JRQ81_004315 [Phrynocephalus forsythii]
MHCNITCTFYFSFMLQLYQHVLSLVFAVQEIRENPQLVPNVTLGFQIYNSYFIPSRTYHAALRIFSTKGRFVPNYDCDAHTNLMTVIGGPNPPVIRHMATILHMFKVPQLNHFLRRVSFNNSAGVKISFTQDGELEAGFDVIHWVPFPNQSFLRVRVGEVDPTAPHGKSFTIDEKAILWPSRFNQALPLSLCNSNCYAGYRKVEKEGKPFCCYECRPCPEGKISNQKALLHAVFQPAASSDLHAPKLVIQPNYPEYFEGERIMLICSAFQNGTVEGYRFFNSEGQMMDKMAANPYQKGKLPLQLRVNDTGDYFCDYWMEGSGEAYNVGDSVSLLCSAPPEAKEVKEFHYFSDFKCIAAMAMHEKVYRYNMSIMESNDVGVFKCAYMTRLSGRYVLSQKSDPVSIERTGKQKEMSVNGSRRQERRLKSCATRTKDEREGTGTATAVLLAQR